MTKISSISRFGLYFLLISCQNTIDENLLKAWATSPKTQVFFQQATYDFGKVAVFDSITHYYRLENNGVNPLHVLRIKTPCSCIKVLLPKHQIKPNTRDSIGVRFYANNNRGHHHKRILLWLNTSPMGYELKFFAEVK